MTLAVLRTDPKQSKAGQNSSWDNYGRTVVTRPWASSGLCPREDEVLVCCDPEDPCSRGILEVPSSLMGPRSNSIKGALASSRFLVTSGMPCAQSTA